MRQKKDIAKGKQEELRRVLCRVIFSYYRLVDCIYTWYLQSTDMIYSFGLRN